MKKILTEYEVIKMANDLKLAESVDELDEAVIVMKQRYCERFYKNADDTYTFEDGVEA